MPRAITTACRTHRNPDVLSLPQLSHEPAVAHPSFYRRITRAGSILRHRCPTLIFLIVQMMAAIQFFLFSLLLLRTQSLTVSPTQTLRFFNSGKCPFAQRAWIALEESEDADYTTTLVDLQNKSPEFVELYAKSNPIPNARAKVPLLQIDSDTFLCESMVVAQYVAETYPSSRLLPKEPSDRATMRLFTELCGSVFSFSPLLGAKEGEDFDAALKKFKEGLVNTDAFLKHSHPDGPFVLGEAFTLAECSTAPSVQRCCVVLPSFTGGDSGKARVDPIEICDELGLDRLKQWVNAVLSRPSVKKTGVPAGDLIENISRRRGLSVTTK